MSRADLFRRPTRPLRPARLALVVAAALQALAVGQPRPALAQSAPPEGVPADLRYAPLSAGGVPPLAPRAPGQDAQPPVPFPGSVGGVDYASNAAVGRIVVETDRDQVPADGRSPIRLTIRVYGHDGRPLAGRALVSIEHSAGRIHVPGAPTDEAGPRGIDADRATPGVQLEVRDGVAHADLLAPMSPQEVRLRVSAGREEAAGTLTFVPDLRPMVAAGLVEGILDLRSLGRTALQPPRRGDVFEQEIRAWSREFSGGKASAAARSAFFLKGTIRGDLLLTAAYDSDKITRARLLRDIQPDRFYPVYGDASLRAFDARSGSRLYVRVDSGRSYALFGDFVTGDGFSQPIGQGAVASLRQRSLGAYNRTATGVRLHEETATRVVNAFVFNDTLRQAIDEFASQGSGPYALSNNAVVEGSEKVEVIVRDRAQPSRIVSVRPLVRLVDYSFEPFSGRILLATFLPAFDDALNPVSLRVTYEVDQKGQAFWVGGVDGQFRLTDTLDVGGNAVVDDNPLAPYRLASANATWRPGPATAVVVEVAETHATVNTNVANRSSTPGLADAIGDARGQAWRVEAAHDDERNSARVFVGRSQPSFHNPSAPLNGGREETVAKVEHRVAPEVALYGEGLASRNRVVDGGSRSAAGTGLRWKATETVTLDAGLRSTRETIGAAGNALATSPFGLTAGLTGSLATGAAGGALGLGTQPLDPATGLPILGSQSLAVAPNALPPGTRLESDTLRLGAGWRATDRLLLAGAVESEVAGDERRRATAAADYRLGERSRAYARYEHQSGWVTLSGASATGRSADTFVAGVDAQVLRDTQLFNEYRLRDSASGRDLQLASGIRNVHEVAPGVRLTTAYERISPLSNVSARAQAVAAGVDYAASPLWRGSTRIEHRRSGDAPATPADDAFDTTLWQAMAARKLDRDWTLLARNYLLHTRYRARGTLLQDRAQLGVAYRDTDTNRVNALARVELKTERDGTQAAGPLSTRAWIVSTHADWHPSRPWWLTGRYAAKWQRDRFESGVEDDFSAQLVSGRIVYDVTEAWDVGLMAAAQLGRARAMEYAWGVEAGRLLKQNLWLSVGVNASGFRGDADLAGYEYTRRGVYVRLRFKFDETLLDRARPT